MLWLIQIFSLINDLFWVVYHFFRDTRILMCDGYVSKNDAVAGREALGLLLFNYTWECKKME